ncbi:MAG TPA: aminopeptidase N [Streptosporangiaceae bacterium]|jgi:aminopeptidase N
MPVAEITRAETQQRAQLLHVRSYDVALDLTPGPPGNGARSGNDGPEGNAGSPGPDVFGSVSVIRFDCAEPGASSFADLVAEAVHEITLNGVPVDPAAWRHGRIALTGLAASNELRVVADCGYTSAGVGMHRSVDSADGKVYLYAKFEPAYARSVYACFEQPDLKATVSFHVTAPAHWTVLSNQPAPEPEPGPDGQAVWHFPPTPRVPTYVTTVVAGDYHLVRGTHTTASGQQIPLELACRASLAGHLDPEPVFEITRTGLDYYAALFGTGYPFAKYGQVFVPGFSAGATEDAGCVLVSEEFLFRSTVTDAMHLERAMVILHEMAHMWFGDLVTMRWWDDLWLNESFAEFCAYLALDEATRFTDAWPVFAVGRKSWGYQQDRLPSTHPVAADAPTLSEATANFDGISYAKGAAVLRQLAAYVGRDTFFAAIRAYFAAHGWANATLADFLSSVEAASGQSLDGWSKEWLETAGPNTLCAEIATGADGAVTRFAIRQEAPEQHPVLRSHRIAVGLYQRTADGLARTGQLQADVHGAETELAGLPELAGARQPDLVLLNDGDLGYTQVRFDPRSLATVCAAVGELPDPLSRAVCWNAAVDMVQQAELAMPAFLAMLAGGMRGESSVAMLAFLHGQAEQLMVQFADPRWVPTGRQQLAEAAVTLLESAAPGSDHQLAWAHLLGRTATSPGQLDLIGGLLEGSMSFPGLPVSVGLRWSLLLRLAAVGRAGEANIEAELAGDATDAGRRSAQACLAAMPDAGHKEAAWELLTGGRLDAESVTAIGRGFRLPEHAGLIAPYTGRYFAAMETIWAAGNGRMPTLITEMLFPHAAASAALLEQIGDFLAAAPRNLALARVLTERADIVRRALLSRALPG